MRTTLFTLVAWAALGVAGCGATTGPVANGESAYVNRLRLFRSDMYKCTANDGEPVCKKIEEIEP